MDALAVESQARAKHAIDNGHFEKSVIPVYHDDGRLALDREEFPRPGTTMESLAELKTVFSNFMDMPIDVTGETFRQLVARKYPDLEINHVHHAGNSSGVVDGAAALVLASDDYISKSGLKPRARIRAMATVGGDPTLMLNEPVPAARKVLEKAGMTLDDIDLFEVNEAFSVVAWKFMKDLEIDPAKCNVNGGAMALGHPIAATGSILIGTVLDELERRDLNTGLITMCTGGGMGARHHHRTRIAQPAGRARRGQGPWLHERGQQPARVTRAVSVKSGRALPLLGAHAAAATAPCAR